MRFGSIILIYALMGFAGIAEDKSNATISIPIDPTRIKDGKLMLPSIEGSVDTPGADFKWFNASGGKIKAEIYYCADPAGNVFLISIEPGKKNIRSAKIEYFHSDVEELMQQVNGTFVSEKGELKELPPFPEVFHMSSLLNIGGVERTYERYLIPSKRNMITCARLVSNEIEAAQLKAFTTSVKFPAVPPGIELRFFVYALFGGIFYLAGWGLNALKRRTVILPGLLAIIGIGIGLCVCAGIIDSKTMVNLTDEQQGEKIGYQIGLALFPFLGFLVILIAESKYHQKVAAKEKERALAAKMAESSETQ